uniref:Uncharacterized protein n=1 Tax=Arundo donax TaxID=35708 RepID=A0A0A9UBG1_ARUDO
MRGRGVSYPLKDVGSSWWSMGNIYVQPYGLGYSYYSPILRVVPFFAHSHRGH